MKSILTLICTITLAAGLLLTSQAIGEDHGGDIHFNQPAVGVMFSHNVHVDEAGLDCESCHEDLFAYEAHAAQQQPDFNMKSLYEGKYCGACHDGSTAFASNTRCASCHEGVIGYNRALGIDAEGSSGHH